MQNILFIHQSAELYGSDKALLDLIIGLKIDHQIKPIVIIPNDGPLTQVLQENEIEYFVMPVLKLHKKMFKITYLINLLKDTFISVLKIRKIIKKRSIHIIYSNTFSVMLGVIYSFLFPIKHIWHCHEIIDSPKIFVTIYRYILSSYSVDCVIYNSQATEDNWVKSSNKIKKKSVLIYNGIDTNYEPINQEEILLYRREWFQNINDSSIIFSTVGRLSERKGIELLIDSFNLVHKQCPEALLLIVGSPTPGKEEFEGVILNKIKRYNLTKVIRILPFQNNIHNIWQSIDIAVIPSKAPESFGLVAIEAMLAKKAVIAANHGGLMEIVMDPETGFKIEPNNIDKFSKAMIHLYNNMNISLEMGIKGHERVLTYFSKSQYINKIALICNKYNS